MCLSRQRQYSPEAVRAAVQFAGTLVKLRNDGVQMAAMPATSLEEQQERARIADPEDGFLTFLRYWRFKNRERGGVQTFADLWPGQEQAVAEMLRHQWLYLLKAGKLGFTELECAWDGWRLLFAHPNARVGLFSKDGNSAKELLTIVRYGITRLPDWLRPAIYEGPGGETTSSMILDYGPDDHRVLTSYSTRAGTAIDVSLTHAHVDELSHMIDPEAVWNSVSTIIAPEGTCHVVTRGAGMHVYTARLWRTCSNLGGDGLLHGYFAGWDMRPDRDAGWRERQAATMPEQGLLYYAPETPEDALSGDIGAVYIPISVWDRCHDPELPELAPGDKTQAVMAVDASVTGDLFAIVVVTRDPKKHDNPAIRDVFTYNPREEDGGLIDFDKIERFIRWYIEGGCAQGHPKSMPLLGAHGISGDEIPDCPLCAAGSFDLPGHNVVQFTYDPYQMEDVAQHLMRAGLVWVDAFDQGTERLIADATLYQRAMKLELVHNGSAALRSAVANAMVKTTAGSEDSKMRMVKRAPEHKIDPAVAASMAVKRILELNV